MTYANTPDGTVSGIPVLAYDYTALNAGDEVEAVVVATEVASNVAFNAAGDAFAIRLPTGNVVVYSVP